MTDDARAKTPAQAAARGGSALWALRAFVKLGVLPVLLVASLVLFTALSDRFFTASNLTNVLRQSSYLVMVALGQMIVLVTGGFDLSVGTTLAITSVVGASVMAGLAVAMPDAVAVTITLGVLAGLAAGIAIGVVNGIGVAVFGVSPFIMTLGMSSTGFGIALYLTAGMPVRGMPSAFSQTFDGNLLGLRAPVWAALIAAVVMYLLMSWTRLGRYFYAIGGNLKASALSGVATRLVQFAAYTICAAVTSIAGVMLTARLETGEANIGSSMALESIAACVIAGVSLRGGVGRVELVVLGALFIGVIQNGMNLARVQSYLQIVVTGIILIFAVVADELRRRLMVRLPG